MFSDFVNNLFSRLFDSVHLSRMHKEYLEELYRGKKKSVHWLMGEHNRLFADWFEKKVGFLVIYVVLYVMAIF